VKTSGYTDFGKQRTTVKAFDGATGKGICDGSILRAKVNAANRSPLSSPSRGGTEPVRHSVSQPDDHALKGGLFVTENGEDERGARPTNNSPDRLQLAQQNRDGSPDFPRVAIGSASWIQLRRFSTLSGVRRRQCGAVVGRPVQHVLAFRPSQSRRPGP